MASFRAASKLRIAALRLDRARRSYRSSAASSENLSSTMAASFASPREAQGRSSLQPHRSRTARPGCAQHDQSSSSAGVVVLKTRSSWYLGSARKLAIKGLRCAASRSSRTRLTKRASRPSSRAPLYKARARIEQAVGRLKRFKRSFAAGLCTSNSSAWPRSIVERNGFR
jgi:hypothetical protein